MKRLTALAGTLSLIVMLAACVAVPDGPQAPRPTPTATPCSQGPAAGAAAGGESTSSAGVMTSGGVQGGTSQPATLSPQDDATRQAAMQHANPARPMPGCPTDTPVPGPTSRAPESGTPRP